MYRARKNFLSRGSSSQRRYNAEERKNIYMTCVGYQESVSNKFGNSDNQNRYRPYLYEKARSFDSKNSKQGVTPEKADVDLTCTIENVKETENEVHDVHNPDKSEMHPFAADIISFILNEMPEQSKATKLINMVNTHCPHLNLPKNAKTALGMPRVANVSTMGKGSYCHFGLEWSIQDFLQHEANRSVEQIDIQLSTDGFPLFNGGGDNLWPILGSIVGRDEVFIIGCFCGKSKPDDSNEFLRPTVDEIKKLMEPGVQYNNQKIVLNIHSLICDVPAKSMVLMSKGHSGYSCCPKCTIRGTYIDRVCFPELEFVERTDDDIQNLVDSKFQHGRSILLDIKDFSVIRKVPFDYMHLIIIGVGKRNLSLWLKDAPRIRNGISLRILHTNNAIVVNKYLELLALYTPQEFPRKCKDITKMGNWKATQHRLFLLYVGPVVLLSILDRNDDVYVNYVTLNVATRLLCLKLPAESIAYADSLMKYYVESFLKLYGPRYVSSNVHALLHIAKDVENLGPLDTISAFKYENFLRLIKRQISAKDKVLSNFYKRYIAMRDAGIGLSTKPSPSVIGPSRSSSSTAAPKNLPPMVFFSKYQFSKFFLTNKTPDNCCMIDNDFVIVENFAVDDNNEHFLIGRKYEYLCNLYEKPCPSSLLDIHVAKQLSSLRHWPIGVVKSKCMRLPVPKEMDTYAVIPLLHTYIETPEVGEE